MPVYDVNSFSITTHNNDSFLKTEFEKNSSNNWHMNTPIRSKADTNAIRMFLSKLMSTRIESFIADSVERKLVRSELERPFVKMKI